MPSEKKTKKKSAGNGTSIELKKGLSRSRERNFSMQSQSSMDQVERVKENDLQTVRIALIDLFYLHYIYL